jgi:putative lipoic acid-binding regulatory protein
VAAKVVNIGEKMAQICDLNGKKPDIIYPTFWEYKVIFDNLSDENSIIKECVGERNHKITPSNTSKNGKFKSFNLSVLVNNDSERLELFSLLKKHSKFVL